MKFMIFGFMALFSFQASAKYSFTSLYAADGFVTERLLPFRVTSTDTGTFEIKSVIAEPPCYGMVDKYRANIVLLYCKAIDADFKLKVSKDGKDYELLAPVITVKKVAVVSSTPGDDTLVDPYASARQKFKVNCLTCHSSIPIAKGVTSKIITDAFAGKTMRNGTKTTGMKNFDKFFTTSELNAFVKYINEAL